MDLNAKRIIWMIFNTLLSKSKSKEILNREAYLYKNICLASHYILCTILLNYIILFEFALYTFQYIWLFISGTSSLLRSWVLFQLIKR
jgi:hypothetical protein